VQETVVVLCGRLDEFMTPELRLVEHVRGNIARGRVDALVVLVEEDGVHLDEVDDSDEPVLGTYRKLEQDGTGMQAVLHHLDDIREIRTGTVHLVDVREARYAVCIGLVPHRLRLRLDATYSTEDRDGSVENAQRPLDLHGEVHVAGRIDNLDAMVLPEACGRGRRDSDAAFLLLNHPVHGCSAVVDLADLVRLARVEQDALGRRGLASVYVGHDPDVPGLGERESLRSHLAV
jgi:hypothetical protein